MRRPARVLMEIPGSASEHDAWKAEVAPGAEVGWVERTMAGEPRRIVERNLFRLPRQGRKER
jgi:hypothetical protein